MLQPLDCRTCCRQASDKFASLSVDDDVEACRFNAAEAPLGGCLVSCDQEGPRSRSLVPKHWTAKAFLDAHPYVKGFLTLPQQVFL